LKVVGGGGGGGGGEGGDWGGWGGGGGGGVYWHFWEKKRLHIWVPIYKYRGDKLQCKNYRGISLLYTGYRILTTVFNNRFKKYTEHIIGAYQTGFRTEKSTTDQIFTVKNLLEKSWELNVEYIRSYLIFRKHMTLSEGTKCTR